MIYIVYLLKHTIFRPVQYQPKFSFLAHSDLNFRCDGRLFIGL